MLFTLTVSTKHSGKLNNRQNKCNYFDGLRKTHRELKVVNKRHLYLKWIYVTCYLCGCSLTIVNYIKYSMNYIENIYLLNYTKKSISLMAACHQGK